MAFKRETAYRVFSTEFNNSNSTIEATGEMEASYVVSPLGAKMNRVHVVGVCTDVDVAGESGDQYRMRVSDPSGQFFINAGQFQPEAAQVMSELQPPCFVAVTGKARAWTGDDGQVRVNIRPEHVSVVDEATRDHWVLTTAQQTKERLDVLERLRSGTTPETLSADGVRPAVIEGANLAQERYAMVDLDGHRSVIDGALRGLLPGGSFETHEVTPSEPAMGGAPAAAAAPAPAGAPAPAWTAPAAPATDEAQDAFDDAIFEIVKRLEGDDGARWDDIVAESQSMENADDDAIEESLNRLMDKGLVYEPTLGVLRTT